MSACLPSLLSLAIQPVKRLDIMKTAYEVTSNGETDGDIFEDKSTADAYAKHLEGRGHAVKVSEVVVR